MKIILLQKVPGLGDTDDIKDVKDGYAVNFLFPKHLAVQASVGALADLEAQKSKRAKEEERDLREQQDLASGMDGMELAFAEKTSESGSLYSAVTAQRVADLLGKMGYEVDKKQIEVPIIKSIGEYSGKIRFRHGLEAEVRIIVSARK